MSRAVKQPIGQKRLTNVAVVRLKTQGLRFEVACYRNTVMAWRNKIEKNLDDVLQSTTIYTNVSKGVFANKEDLQRVFGTTDEAAICVMVLERGELQVSELERQREYAQLARDVVQVLVDKCVNPDTGVPYTAGVLERALRACHVALDPKRSAKQQALDALPKLAASFPIARARMRFRVAAPAAAEAALRAQLAEHGALVEAEDTQGGLLTVTCTAEPSSYRALDAFARGPACGGAGRLEVVSLAVSGATAAAGGAGGQDAAEAQRRHEAALEAALAAAMLGDDASGGHAAPHATPQAAPQPQAAPAAPAAPVQAAPAAPASQLVYARGPIAALPDAHASRRERFAELDALQPGWAVELRARTGAGAAVDAVFYPPGGGAALKSYAEARRAALKARDAAA